MTAAAPLRLRVAARRQEAEGICSFELVDAAGAALPAFTAGAHVDVQVPGGPVRPYSLCNDPRETQRYLIAVLREPASRGGSAGMHDRVQVGDEVSVGAPRNLFALDESAPRHLLLAGGIGITPLLAMAERLAAQEADFDLHYATRSRARTAFADRLAAAPFAARVRHHFDDGDAAQRLDLPRLLGDEVASGTHLYACGPQGFMDAVRDAARAQGWPEARLHFESFSAAPAGQAGDQAFELLLSKSGRVVPVAADQSAAKALEAAGIFVPTSCEQGVCGTCLTRVVDGTPDHRDQYLTPEEQAANDQFTPCCSRARSARLVLDL
jgi:vanillate monooxygenase ferredoxin subunit